MAHAPVSFRSIVLATLAAGPLFLLGMVVSALMSDSAAAIPVDIWPDESSLALILVELPAGLFVVTIIGSVIAFLPNLIGATVMAWLSDRNDGARLPVTWAIIGGLISGGSSSYVIGDDHYASPIFVVTYAFTGACCALICRRGLGKGNAT